MSRVGPPEVSLKKLDNDAQGLKIKGDEVWILFELILWECFAT